LRIAQTDPFSTPLGATWKKEYNGFYKVSKTIDPMANETQFAYDIMANLTKVTDAEGQETDMTSTEAPRSLESSRHPCYVTFSHRAITSASS